MADRHPLAAALSGYRHALTFPMYRRLWLAAVVSRTGDVINFVALPLFVYGLTRSAGAVAATVFAEGVGLIGGGVVAQLLVDRVPPRILMVRMDLLRAAAAALLAVIPTFPSAVAVSLVLALATASFNPASSAVIPRLVDDRALPAANGLQWTAGVVLQLLAAPLGGLLVTLASARAAFALNALSFIGSAILLTGLPRLPPMAKPQSSAWLQLPEIIRAVPTVTILPPLLVMHGLAALAVGATSALLVVLARSAYGLDATGYGLWLGAIAVGALIGPLLAPAITRQPPHRVVGAAYVVRGLGDIALGLLRNGIGGGLLLALYGVNTSSGMVSYQTMVQRAVPGAVRGRAFALLDVVWQTGRLISIAGGGALATALGVRALFALGGTLLLCAGVWGLATIHPGGRSTEPV